jgi:hypothetical protein
MPKLIEYLCDFAGCEPKDLAQYYKAALRGILDVILIDKILYKSYGNHDYVSYDGLTHSSADVVPAFGGYMGVSVMQYMYVKHRKALKYPELPCVIVERGGGHNDYIPLELLDCYYNI